jgi:hypothetical protein
MDFTKDRLTAYLKEQHELLQRGSIAIPSLTASKEEWDTYRLAKVSHRSRETWEKLIEAVAYTNKHFSEWHVGRIRSTAGISKDEWFILSNPKSLNLDALTEALKR